MAVCDVDHDASGHDVHVGFHLYTGTGTGCPVPGRRPHGLQRATRRGRASVVAGHLAEAAWFEAASVHAFVGLARELARHGAPTSLRRDAQRAALDEVHHARLMTDVARARGAVPPPARVTAPRRRSLEALAIENATEGVVGETWSALLAYWQARHAPDPGLRSVYARIADNELRHAELAREVDAWCQPRLRPAARRRVGLARRRALTRLARSVRTGAPAALVEELGMPAPAAMRRLFDGARAQLWSARAPRDAR